MSASPEPSLAPLRPFEPVTPKLIPERPRSSGKLWWIVGLTAAIAGAAWVIKPWQRSKPAPVLQGRTVKAIPGVLAPTLRISGSISATSYAAVAAPMMAGPEGDRGLVLTYLPPNGSMVKEGQMIAQIDGQAIQDHVDDLDAQVSQYALELKRLAATQLAALEVMEQRVRTYRALFDRAKQDLRALDVRNAIDQERLHLALEEAQAEYEQSRQSLELMAEQQRAERRINELVQERQVRHRDRHKRDVTQFTIHAPMSGQVVLKTLRRRGQEFQVQIGDEVAPGQQFLRVVELGPMQMDGTINQVESEAVRVGQAATLHFDAYPELVVKGRVQAVGQMATASGRLSNNYIRRIPVRIRIEDRDPRVIPDLTASADVMVAEPADGLILPREAVREEGGRSVVYVRQGDTIEPREVEVGGASNTQITVRSGIQAGEEVMVGN